MRGSASAVIPLPLSATRTRSRPWSVAAALEALDESVVEAHRLSADYELAHCLAARAVVRAGHLEPDADDRAAIVADAVEARRLFGNLGVVSTPVTSVADIWPTGPLARRLAGA